jgi:hypothetical protein
MQDKKPQTPYKFGFGKNQKHKETQELLLQLYYYEITRKVSAKLNILTEVSSVHPSPIQGPLHPQKRF